MKPLLQFRSRMVSDGLWISKVATQLWGSPMIISRDKTYDLLKIPAVLAVEDGQRAGFAMYVEDGTSCELVALYSEVSRKGTDTKLVEKVKEIAERDGCKKVWLMTTNDNTAALRFYQKRGFIITAIRTNVIEAQRKIKPIPLLGNDGIPIRDEIELEIIL